MFEKDFEIGIENAKSIYKTYNERLDEIQPVFDIFVSNLNEIIQKIPKGHRVWDGVKFDKLRGYIRVTKNKNMEQGDFIAIDYQRLKKVGDIRFIVPGYKEIIAENKNELIFRLKDLASDGEFMKVFYQDF